MHWINIPLLALFLSAVWIDVPFVQQKEKGCGAASISMVLQYWQLKDHPVSEDVIDPVRIMQQLYSKSEEGIRAQDVEKYFQQNGFRTFSFSGQLEDLEQHIAKGRPLLVSLAAESGAGKFHYVVVAGTDLPNGLVLINDPAERKLLKMKTVNFQKRWAATNNWTLLAIPA